jgi:hypothetical protein
MAVAWLSGQNGLGHSVPSYQIQTSGVPYVLHPRQWPARRITFEVLDRYKPDELSLLPVPQAAWHRVSEPLAGRPRPSDFQWIAGDHLIKYDESARGYQRGFCRDCGMRHLAGRHDPRPTVDAETALACA